ncbi:MAG: hypothetical protein P1P82_05245 [Bacteroidales bacterium]|nr:hypothetical protein [Bacteroidales bacterium]MDT8430845.1 hypothetical protein [Bacteroidales bacterium]
MKRITLIIILAISLSQAKGQDNGFSITGGIGTYDMEALKSYHELLISRLPVEARGFNYFPPFTNIRMNLFRQHTEKMRYGLVYAFSTTGALANYTDYSGYLNLDQVVTAYQFGITANYRILNMDFAATRFDISAYGDLQLAYVRDEVSMVIGTDYYYENNRLVLRTISPMAAAGLDAMFHFSKLAVGVEGGVLFDTGAKFNAGNASYSESAVSLTPPSELKTGMTGLRGGVKVIIWINKELINPE